MQTPEQQRPAGDAADHSGRPAPHEGRPLHDLPHGRGRPPPRGQGGPAVALPRGSPPRVAAAADPQRRAPQEASPAWPAPSTPAPCRRCPTSCGETLGPWSWSPTSPGRPLAAPSNPCGLFDAVHRYPGVLERCIASWQALAAEVDLEPQWRATPLGFLCARSLVRVGGRLVGMILAGGVAPASWPPPPEEAARLAAGLGVPTRRRGAAPRRGLLPRRPRSGSGSCGLLPRSAAFLSRLANQRADWWAGSKPLPPRRPTRPKGANREASVGPGCRHRRHDGREQAAARDWTRPSGRSPSSTSTPATTTSRGTCSSPSASTGATTS